MTSLELPGRRIQMPVVSLYAVQSPKGRWLVYFDDGSDRIAMLLFTCEEAASRYINANPDLLESPGYSLILFCRTKAQLLQMARRASDGGVHAFQVDRMPCGDCWFQIDLERLL